MSLLRFQQELVALYTGRQVKKSKPDTLSAAERLALEGIGAKALARYRRGLALKRRGR